MCEGISRKPSLKKRQQQQYKQTETQPQTDTQKEPVRSFKTTTRTTTAETFLTIQSKETRKLED